MARGGNSIAKMDGVFIAIHRKPHTVLRRFAVQPRTVFSDAPCLRLSVYGYKNKCGNTADKPPPLQDAPASAAGEGRGGGEQSLMNQNSCFSIDCCPHPTPSLLLRKQYLSLREQCLSQRERGLSTEMQTRPRGCLHFVLNAVATRFSHPLPGFP